MSAPAPLAGIGLRLLSVFLITAMSACVHVLTKSLPVGQIMFWRSAFALAPIMGYMALQRDLPRALTTRHPGLHLTRGTLGAVTMALSFLSLAYLPVATAQALAFLVPVLSLPLAARLLGERLTGPVLGAAGIGFAGTLALLWEALALPESGALIGIAAGLGYALTMAYLRIHTKRMTVTESSATIAFYFALTAAAIGLLTLPFGWGAPDLSAWGLLALAGLIGGLGHIVSNEAVKRAPVSTLAPFDFTGLVWALGFDIVLFGLLPTALALLGIAAIACAGLLVALAERARV